MAAEAFENWSNRQLQRGKSATIFFDVINADDESEVEPTLPAYAQRLGQHPIDPNLFCEMPDILQVSPKGMYHVTCKYSPTPDTDFGIGEPILYSVEFGSKSVPIVADVYGNLITNSVSLPFEGVQREEDTVFLVAKRWESIWNIRTYLAYRGSYNSDSFVWPLMGRIDPGQARFVSYAPLQEWAFNHNKIQVAYKIEIAPGEFQDTDIGPDDTEITVWDAFKLRLLDRSEQGTWNDSGTIKRGAFFEQGSKSPAGTVLLDGFGKPVNPIVKVGMNHKDPFDPHAWKDGGPNIHVIEGSEFNASLLSYSSLKPMPFAGLNLT